MSRGATHRPETPLDEHLALVADMSRAFAQSRDPHAMAQVGLQRITHYVGAEASSVFLLEAETSELVCVACYGPVDITGLRIPAHAGIVGRCVDRKASQAVRDARDDPSFAGMVDAETGFYTRSVLVAPLTVAGECLGAIEIINKAGGDGFFSEADLSLLEALSATAALSVANTRLTERLLAQERIERELELARQIQSTLLPVSNDPQALIHGVNLPAQGVSGDFYDTIALPDGRVWFCVGDVSGKGMNAALLMAKTASLFRCLCKTARSPALLLRRINEELCETSAHGMFVTLAGGLYSPASGQGLLANAGHEPPVIHCRIDHHFRELPAESPPLGILPGLDFSEVPFTLSATESLYVFTDGLTEAHDGQGGMIGKAGVERLIDSLAHIAAKTRLEAILQAVQQPGLALRDDLTVLVIDHSAPPLPPLAVRLLTLSLPARPESLRPLREALRGALSRAGLPGAWSGDAVLALDEACQNIIRHAYPLGQEGAITVEAALDSQALTLRVADFAPPAAPEAIRGRDLEDLRPGGLGVHFMAETMDDLQYLAPPPGVGNLLQMVKHRPSGEEGEEEPPCP